MSGTIPRSAHPASWPHDAPAPCAGRPRFPGVPRGSDGDSSLLNGALGSERQDSCAMSTLGESSYAPSEADTAAGDVSEGSGGALASPACALPALLPDEAPSGVPACRLSLCSVHCKRMFCATRSPCTHCHACTCASSELPRAEGLAVQASAGAAVGGASSAQSALRRARSSSSTPPSACLAWRTSGSSGVRPAPAGLAALAPAAAGRACNPWKMAQIQEACRGLRHMRVPRHHEA